MVALFWVMLKRSALCAAAIGRKRPRTMTFTIKQAEAICGTLGYPSKMPGTAYGLPAQACKTGSVLARIKGSVCHDCYALKGNYVFRDVKKSQAKRLVSITDPRWVEAQVALLTKAHNGGKGGRRKGKALSLHHRWHDSGDIQSRDHLAKICAVARATPWLQHWLPTKEGKIVKDFLRDGGEIPDNLTIRLSGTMVDGAAPKALPLTSTVHANGSEPIEGSHRCPAPLQGNKCGECRACWSADVANVSYHLH
jgi:hypothetical protein